MNPFWLAQTATQPQPGGLDFVLFLAPLVLIFWFLVLRPNSKQQKKVQEMVSALKKGDRIVTVGGIYGTVMNIKGDDITIKIDESTNTKMTIIRNAVRSVVSESTGS